MHACERPHLFLYPVVVGDRDAARSGAGITHRKPVGHRCGFAAHVSSADADRADLLRVLANPEVKAVADKAGLDLAAGDNGGSVARGTGIDATGGAGASGRSGARRRPVQGRHLDDDDHHRVAGADPAHRRDRLTSIAVAVRSGRQRAFSVLLAVVLCVGAAEGATIEAGLSPFSTFHSSPSPKRCAAVRRRRWSCAIGVRVGSTPNRSRIWWTAVRRHSYHRAHRRYPPPRLDGDRDRRQRRGDRARAGRRPPDPHADRGSSRHLPLHRHHRRDAAGGRLSRSGPDRLSHDEP